MPMFSWFNLKAAFRIAAAVTAWSILFFLVAALAQQDTPGASKIMVGTVEAPPFAMQTSNGDWEGLSIELWSSIARELGIDYAFVTYDDLGQLKVDLEKSALDLSIAMAVTASHEADFDLSHPFLTSGSAIAIAVAHTQHDLIHFSGRLVDRFVSLEFLALISMLVILAFVAGSLVWFFEGRHQGDDFSGRPIKGIWQGLWWAMVTMTTVGYGDKTPRTVGGRIVALVWMFTGIGLVAVFTAVVTASLTVGELRGKVQGLQDLHGVRVGSVVLTESLDFLGRRGIAARSFKNQQDGLLAVVDGEVDAFVFNELVLKNLTRTAFPGRIKVLPEIFDQYYVSLAMPSGSALREPLNRAMLKIIATEDWARVKARYVDAGG